MIIKRLPNLDKSQVKPNIGKAIREAREQCGLTQQELGRAIGFESPTALSFIESGQRSVSALKLWDIASVTSLPIQWFYTDLQKAGEQ